MRAFGVLAVVCAVGCLSDSEPVERGAAAGSVAGAGAGGRLNPAPAGRPEAGRVADGGRGGSAGRGPDGVVQRGAGRGAAGMPAAVGGTGGRTGAGGRAGAGAGGLAGGLAGAGGAAAGTRDILVPGQGALLGQFYGAGTIQTAGEKLGHTPKVHLTYYAWSDDWARGSRTDLDAGRVPLVNWEPFDVDLDAILAGTHDAMIDTRARAAKDLGAPFFLDWGAEMNGDWSPWGGAQNGMSAEKYVATFRHLHDRFDAAGATNVIWLWCPNVTDEPRATWNQALEYYPGDAYVDWTCVDGYNWGGSGGGGGWESFRDVFAGIYPKLATKNKPIMIGEMASAEVGGDKADWIRAIIPTLRSDYPLIKGLVWFDIDKETDWRISSSPEAEAAFKELANDAYFNP